MLDWLFGSKSDNTIVQILAPSSVGYLSASCCNPAAGTADEELVKNLKQALSNVGLDTEIKKETLTGAQAGMRSAMTQLNLHQGKVVTKVMGLFSTRGFEAFPILLIGGDVAAYGGVPAVDEIEKHLRAHLPALTAKPAEAPAPAEATKD
jgi:hypothetical protein